MNIRKCRVEPCKAVLNCFYQHCCGKWKKDELITLAECLTWVFKCTSNRSSKNKTSNVRQPSIYKWRLKATAYKVLKADLWEIHYLSSKMTQPLGRVSLKRQRWEHTAALSGGAVLRRPFPLLSYLQHPSDCSGPIWGCTSHRQERRKVSSEQLLPPSLTQSKQCMTQTDRNMVRNDPSIPALMTKLTRLFDSAILIKRLLTSGFHFTASVLQGRCLIC